MESTTIETEDAENRRIDDFSAGDRAIYLSISFISSIMLVTGRLLTPSSSGVGTHQQLGFPPCLFLHFTGVPCPNCGLTTSFAHAARLSLKSALLTQPFGLTVFALTVISIPLSAYLSFRKISWNRIIYTTLADRFIYSLIAFYIICWIYKILTMKFYSAANN